MTNRDPLADVLIETADNGIVTIGTPQIEEDFSTRYRANDGSVLRVIAEHGTQDIGSHGQPINATIFGAVGLLLTDKDGDSAEVVFTNYNDLDQAIRTLSLARDVADSRKSANDRHTRTES